MRAGLAIAVAAVAVLAAAPAGATTTRHRYVLYTVALNGVQTTTWQSHGAQTWCDSSSQPLSYDGSGTEQMTFNVTPAVDVGIEPGRAPRTLDATLQVTEQRAGSFILHYGALTDRPAFCDPVPTTDVAADASRCGTHTFTTAAGVRTVNKRPTLLSARRVADDGCPFLAANPDINGAWSVPRPALDHPEANDALIALDVTSLTAPTTRQLHTSQTWTTPIEGGTLTVTTTLDLTAKITLRPTVVPGHSIAGVSLGETYARLRAAARSAGGVSVPDSGFRTGRRVTWDIGVAVPYVYPGTGGHDQIRAVVTAHAKPGKSRLVRGGPPANARVTFVSLGSTLEVTAAGIEAGSTLADAREARPRGHLFRKCGSIACASTWLVDGPGRRRTAFTLFKGVVQDIEIGCRSSQGVVPIAQDATC